MPTIELIIFLQETDGLSISFKAGMIQMVFIFISLTMYTSFTSRRKLLYSFYHISWLYYFYEFGWHLRLSYTVNLLDRFLKLLYTLGIEHLFKRQFGGSVPGSRVYYMSSTLSINKNFYGLKNQVYNYSSVAVGTSKVKDLGYKCQRLPDIKCYQVINIADFKSLGQARLSNSNRARLVWAKPCLASLARLGKSRLRHVCQVRPGILYHNSSQSP